MLQAFLANAVPTGEPQVTEFFTGDLSSLPTKERNGVEWNGLNLRKLLVDGAGAMPIGVLRRTLKYANSATAFGGIYSAIKERMAAIATKDFTDRIIAVAEFRNNYVARQEKEVAKQGLKDWIAALAEMRRKTPPSA